MILMALLVMLSGEMTGVGEGKGGKGERDDAACLFVYVFVAGGSRVPAASVSRCQSGLSCSGCCFK